jgi:hypothetical protein
MSSPRPTTVVLSTTLDPVAHGELAPGLWKRVQHATADLAPRERSAAVAEMVGAVLRQRGT